MKSTSTERARTRNVLVKSAVRGRTPAVLAAILVLTPIHAEKVSGNEWRKAADHVDWTTFVVVDVFLDQPMGWLARRRSDKAVVVYVCSVPDPVSSADVTLGGWDFGAELSADWDPVPGYVDGIHGEREGHWWLEFDEDEKANELTVARLQVRVLHQTVRGCATRMEGDQAWSIPDDTRHQTAAMRFPFRH